MEVRRLLRLLLPLLLLATGHALALSTPVVRRGALTCRARVRLMASDEGGDASNAFAALVSQLKQKDPVREAALERERG